MRRLFPSILRQATQIGNRRNKSSEHRLKTRRHNGQLESLEQRVLLAGDLVSHWTADALNDNHDNGQVVADWNDIVSNVVANSSGAPLLVKNALSGHSVIRFNTSD